MNTSPEINELATALAQAQGQIVGAAKSAANPFFKSKYADLESVWEACRKPLTDHGLSILQSPRTETVNGSGLRVSVETTLLHTSGQWMSDVLSVSAKEDSPQALGSCITYLRRYALQSFAGVAPTDDDAEAAEGRAGKAQLLKPAASRKPTGFDDWLTDLGLVSVEGSEKLRTAWRESKPEFRDYLTVHEPKALGDLKARGTQSDRDALARSAP